MTTTFDSTKTDIFIAVALPCIAIAWVIADAASGFITPAQADYTAPPAVVMTDPVVPHAATSGPRLSFQCSPNAGAPLLDNLCQAHRNLLSVRPRI